VNQIQQISLFNNSMRSPYVTHLPQHTTGSLHNTFERLPLR